MMQNGYFENMVKTASPLQMVIMLYDRAIANLRTARELMLAGEQSPEALREKLEALGKAADIIAWLDGTLNFEKGGQIAQNLHQIYDTLLHELVKVSAKDDPEVVGKMIGILENLREAWRDAEKDLRKQKAKAPEETNARAGKVAASF